nr:MAG TPA: hypothetical protein [Caudoviricetes sp.]
MKVQEGGEMDEIETYKAMPPIKSTTLLIIIKLP